MKRKDFNRFLIEIRGNQGEKEYRKNNPLI